MTPRKPTRPKRKTQSRSKSATSSSSLERRSAPGLRSSTIVVTNLGKLVAMVIAVNETMIRTEVRDSVIAVVALFILGAQVVEEAILHAIDRIFSRPEEEDQEEEG